MKKIGAAIYLSVPEITSLGVSDGYLKKAMFMYRSGKSALYENISDSQNKKKKLISFSSLPDKIKSKWIETNGDPTECKAVAPSEYLQPDVAAHDYYTNYTFSTLRSLSSEEVEKYTKAAQWLNLLRVADETNPFRDTYGITRKEFYDQVIEIIKTDSSIDLPTNYSNLREKLRKYITGGYASLVPARFGNRNAEKLGTIQKTYLRTLYANNDRPQKVLYTQIAWLFNQHALKEGWEPVTPQAIYNYLSSAQVQAQCYKERHGKKHFNDKYDPINHRERPSQPDYLWVLDGTPFELYYNENGKARRLYVYFVIDAHSWAVLGAAAGTSETQELVMEALRNACYLTGTLPYQLQYDNSSANKACEPLFKKIAPISFAAGVGNAKAKVIEPLTKHINEQVLKLYENYSGANITAKKLDSHINQDAMKAVMKNLPDRDGVLEQIFISIAWWNRRTIETRGKTPNEFYRIECQRREFSMNDRLRLFGNFRRKPVTYTNEGITLYLNGQETHYWVDDVDFYAENIYAKFRVQYDKSDASRIALYHGDRFCTYAELKGTVPMARMDFKDGDGAKLAHMQDFKKRFNDKIDAKREGDRKMLEAAGIYKLGIEPGALHKDALNDSEDMLKQLAAAVRTDYVVSEDDDTPMPDLTRGIHGANKDGIPGYLDIVED
jgi:hypothetical protein